MGWPTWPSWCREHRGCLPHQWQRNGARCLLGVLLDCGPDVKATAQCSHCSGPFLACVWAYQSQWVASHVPWGRSTVCSASTRVACGPVWSSGAFLWRGARVVRVELADEDHLEAVRAVVDNVSPTDLVRTSLRQVTFPMVPAGGSSAMPYGPSTVMVHSLCRSRCCVMPAMSCSASRMSTLLRVWTIRPGPMPMPWRGAGRATSPGRPDEHGRRSTSSGGWLSAVGRGATAAGPHAGRPGWLSGRRELG